MGGVNCYNVYIKSYIELHRSGRRVEHKHPLPQTFFTVYLQIVMFISGPGCGPAGVVVGLHSWSPVAHSSMSRPILSRSPEHGDFSTLVVESKLQVPNVRCIGQWNGQLSILAFIDNLYNPFPPRVSGPVTCVTTNLQQDPCLSEIRALNDYAYLSFLKDLYYETEPEVCGDGG